MDDWTLVYYQFLHVFHREPFDIEDFIDGCQAALVINEIEDRNRGL
jgi:hypothetical protein